MSSFRTEISIPVNKDNRTLEERRKEDFNVLEEKYSKPKIDEDSKFIGRDRPSLFGKMNHDPFFDSNDFFKSDFDNWDSDVSDWIQNSRRRWDDEMTRIKRSMFSLESDRDELNFNSWDPFRSRRRLDDFGKRDSEIERHHKIFNNLEGSKTMRESKNKVFMPSKYLDNDDTSMQREDMQNNFYEYDQNGELHFKIRFEAKHYKPEDIKVTCSGSNLNIAIQKPDLHNIDLHKSIVIPKCVDSQNFQCHITQDGVLVLEAPVKSPDYTSLVSKERMFDDSLRSPIPDRSQSLMIRNTTGPTILNDEKGKRVHLEIPVENEYVPSDFSVTTELNKISVKGRHEVKTANSSSFKEFSQYYEIPESIDPMSVNFNVIDGMLIIEAAVQ